MGSPLREYRLLGLRISCHVTTMLGFDWSVCFTRLDMLFVLNLSEFEKVYLAFIPCLYL